MGRLRFTRSLLVVACAALVWLPSGQAAEEGEKATKVSPFTVPNPGAQLWKGVRRSVQGTSQVQGPETGVLISSAGEDWRQLRNGPVKRYGGWALFAVVVLLLLFQTIHGGVKLEHGRSGRTVARWPLLHRVLHWYTAVLFVILALTGLSLLFGRAVLLPLLGLEAFGAWAQLAKTLHNYLGPFFVAGVVLMIVAFIRHNLPALVDVTWALQGGGFFGKVHPHAGRVNAGEKLFTFWMMATVGIVACYTGLVLDFPIYDFPFFEQSREGMQLANIVHAVATVVWLFFAVGHIYLGTAGVEGTFEGMWEGRVDVNWAKQHHDLWYEEVREQGGEQEAAAGPGEGAAGAREQPT